MLLISNITSQPITKYKINDTLFDQLKKYILEITPKIAMAHIRIK